MRKKIFGRRFKRDSNERKALFRSLMVSLVTYGKIKTTEAKAKAIKAEFERILTKAKNKGENASAIITSKLGNKEAAERLISEIAPKFATRPGGYTRIMRTGSRVKDAAEMVFISFVEEVAPSSPSKKKRSKLKKAEPLQKTSTPAKKRPVATKKSATLGRKK